MLASQIEDAEQTLAADRQKVAREAAAAETERRADAIDATASKLVQTLKTVVNQFEDMRLAIDGGGVGASAHVPSVSHSAETYALSILLSGLEGALPGVATKLRSVGIVIGETADIAARRLQTDRLRLHAEALQTGRAPVNLLPTPNECAYRPVALPQIEKTRVVLVEPIIFQDERHQAVRCIAGEVEVPVPVAARARELGIGHPPASREGQRLTNAMGASPPKQNGNWRDIGVNLALSTAGHSQCWRRASTAAPRCPGTRCATISAVG